MKQYIFTETTTYAIHASNDDEADELFEKWCSDENSVPISILDCSIDRDGFF